jgi:peptidoglycan/LPS O-acetylase OafA/YrhL
MKKLTVLESLRGFASIYVALGHFLLSYKYTPRFISPFFKFGQEAVVIFFILSGIVIWFSNNNTRDKSLRSYFIKRTRRIYFPFICALIVSIIFVNHNFSVKELVGNLLMLQDFGSAKPGNIVSPFLGNLPLWSLSYEWVFYLIFPFIYPVIEHLKNRVHVIGLFSIINLIIYILFPNHIFLVLAYFLIWWTGLELGEYFLGDHQKRQHKGLILYYILILGILAVNCAYFYYSKRTIQVGFYPYLLLRHYAFTFICFLLTIYFTSYLKKALIIIQPFSYIAPISYGIYILHFPLLLQAQFGLTPVLEIAAKMVLVLGLAYLIEVVLQPQVNKLIK